MFCCYIKKLLKAQLKKVVKNYNVLIRKQGCILVDVFFTRVLTSLKEFQIAHYVGLLSNIWDKSSYHQSGLNFNINSKANGIMLK